MLSRRTFVSLAACACLPPSAADAQGGAPYVCPPCGCPAHDLRFDKPGVCPACGMTLVSLGAATPSSAASPVRPGAGVFLAPGGSGREAKVIQVHYYWPAAFTPRSPVLLLAPGAGRNGADYRNAWIATAEAKGVLVAALSFPETDYDFAAYQMGGVIRNLRFTPLPGSTPEVVRLRDEDIRFDPNPDSAQWIFADFDRVFGLLAQASGSMRTGYDAFGHSAGGQILHRLALFRPGSKAERIVAANSGFYTLPDLAVPQPFGLGGVGVSEPMLKAALATRLTLLLGERDDGDEAGGIQLRTPILDRQGEGRLARGRAFFAAGERQAKAMRTPFGWRLETVPNVGHDYRRMSEAGARVLYGG